MIKEIYRGHDIVLLDQSPRCAVIFERLSGTRLPTKIIAHDHEPDTACVHRARRLIDLYLEASPAH